MFRRNGLSEKYEYPGIYSISLEDTIVYIGKSENMLERVAQHYVGIQTGSERKYRVLAEAQNAGYSVRFDVVYYAQEDGYYAIEEEIGRKEGEYIRRYMPPLNYQIPKEEDWRKFTVNKRAQTITFQDILREYLEKGGNGNESD